MSAVFLLAMTVASLLAPFALSEVTYTKQTALVGLALIFVLSFLTSIVVGAIKAFWILIR